MTKCHSCGYLHYATQLNCPKCGSFYTEIIDNVAVPEETEQKTSSVMAEIKQPSKNSMPIGNHND